MVKINKDIAEIMKDFNDDESDSGSDSYSQDSNENEEYESNSDEDSNEYESDDGNARLNQLLSASMDKSGRLLHAEGPSTRRKEAMISNDDERIDLQELIQTLNEGSDSDDESKEDGKEQFSAVVQKEDTKKQLKILSDKNSMFQIMNEHQLRRIEREETEKIVDAELKDWEGLVEKVHTSRHKPLIYADASNPKTTPATGELKVIDDFDRTLKEKREKYDEKYVNIPDKLDENTLVSKEAMIEQAKKIAQRKRMLAIEHAKLSRLKKIKSKEYRRRLRKRKEKEQEKQQELEDEMDEDIIKEKLEEEHRKLVTERITLRHKAQTSWSKRAQRYTHANQSLMSALTQKFQLANELRSKQSTIKDDDNDMFDDLLDKSKREDVVNNLLSLNSDDKKGILNMKFMKEARLKEKENTLRILEELDQEKSSNSYSSSDDEHPQERSNNHENQYGKMTFTATNKKIDMSSDEEVNDNEKIKFKSNSFSIQNLNHATLKEEITQDSDSETDDSNQSDDEMKNEEDSNFSDSESSSNSESSHESLEQNSDIPNFLLQRLGTKSKNLNVSSTKTRATLESDSSDSENEENPWLFKNNLEKKKPTKRIKKQEINLSDSESSDSESDNEDISFQQDVKKAAFAADDVKLEFEKEKQKSIDKSIFLPNLELQNMPGWGGEFIGEGINWEGEFIEKQQKMQDFEKRIKNEKAKERIDYNLDHVVIRETARVPDDYLLETHRHSKIENEQLIYSQLHDRANSIPLGPEWNSVKGYSNAITPRINLIPGKKIEPISKNKGELYANLNVRNNSLEDVPRKRKRV